MKDKRLVVYFLNGKNRSLISVHYCLFYIFFEFDDHEFLKFKRKGDYFTRKRKEREEALSPTNCFKSLRIVPT